MNLTERYIYSMPIVRGTLLRITAIKRNEFLERYDIKPGNMAEVMHAREHRCDRYCNFYHMCKHKRYFAIEDIATGYMAYSCNIEYQIIRP